MMKIQKTKRDEGIDSFLISVLKFGLPQMFIWQKWILGKYMKENMRRKKSKRRRINKKLRRRIKRMMKRMRAR